jgi:hypothetical protein
MDVRMMLQDLAPGVKNHGHTELGAEMPGIGRDGGECLSRRAEQDRVDDGLVLERDLADRCRQCEDDMKVRHRQQFGLPIREPLGPRQPLAFGTVTVAARVVSDAGCTAIVSTGARNFIEAVQRRLDEHPEKMRQRRETVEHPFGTIKARMGATHFLMKTLPRVASEMALHVLAYNLTRVMNIMGIQPLMAAIRA